MKKIELSYYGSVTKFNRIIILSLLFIMFVFSHSAFSNSRNNNSTENSIKIQCEKAWTEINNLTNPQNFPKIENCQLAYKTYQEYLKNCSKPENFLLPEEENTRFQDASFLIGSCFKKNNQEQRAKEVYQTTLEAPNWKSMAYECDGHLELEQYIEALALDPDKHKCVSKTELNNILDKFKSSKDIKLLEKLRGPDFSQLFAMEGCGAPFSKLEHDITSKVFESPNWQLNPIYRGVGFENESYLYYTIKGFDGIENTQIILAFVNINDKEHLPSKKRDNTHKETTPCYNLIGYFTFNKTTKPEIDGFSETPP